MKEFIVAAWDDVCLKQGTKVPATATVTLGLDGTWYELDLTDENYRQLMEDLELWVEVGHKPETDLGEHQQQPRRMARRSADTDTLTYNRMLRDFAKVNGLRYVTDKGDYYYSVALRNAFDAFQAGAPESEWRKIYGTIPDRGKRRDN